MFVQGKESACPEFSSGSIPRRYRLSRHLPRGVPAASFRPGTAVTRADLPPGHVGMIPAVQDVEKLVLLPEPAGYISFRDVPLGIGQRGKFPVLGRPVGEQLRKPFDL
ncbi:MAG: hypothetical protein ACRDPY_50120 [Streptosporangiaceae bacterium]